MNSAMPGPRVFGWDWFHCFCHWIGRRRPADALFAAIGFAFLGLIAGDSRAERINHEGRILGPEIAVTQPILFNTPEADAVVSALQIFPVTSAWNEDISRRPLLANSDAMIAQIISDLSATRRTLRLFSEMNFVLIPDNQVSVPIDFVDYPDESDPSPYPIPDNMPIETWPRETGDLSLVDWQMDVNDDGGDRHAIIAQPGAGGLWEMWQARLRSTNVMDAANWQSANGAKFDLKSNTLRPNGWTSGDAAGLPMFPALVRYDECLRGRVEHAMRIVVKRTRVGPIYPARHQASVGNLTNPNIPAMGQRLRLKAGFITPANYTLYEQAVVYGLKKYGAMVADNGNFFSISITPDDRYPDGAFDHITSLSITNFEVIQTTGENEGPRSAGAPAVVAGPDFTADVGVPVSLKGWVAAGSLTATNLWQTYSGPANAMFEDASRTNASATFPQAGTYTLVLSAKDGVHAPAYDAVVVNVGKGIRLSISRVEAGAFQLNWAGGSPPFVVEYAAELPAAIWTPVLTNQNYQAEFYPRSNAGYWRVRGQ